MNKFILAAALSALSVPVYAYPAIDEKSSTIDLGVEVAFLMPKLGDMQILNAGIGLYPFKYSLGSIDASKLVAPIHSSILSFVRLETLHSWHLMEGGLHLNGLLYSFNNLTMISQSGSRAFTSEIDPYNVVSRQSENVTADFDKGVYNVEIGWGKATKNPGLTFTNEIGIMFQGSPKSSVTPNVAGVVAADIKQTSSDLNNSLNNFKVYPFLSIGVGYTF